MFKFPVPTPQQLDGINIGLMLVSLVLAYLLPFELFLFSYAVLGPLHYLTEISWLHQKKYYIPGKKTFVYFAIIATLIGLLVFISNYGADFYQYFTGKTVSFELEDWGTNLILYVFFLSLILVLLEKRMHRILAGAILTVVVLLFNFERRCIQVVDYKNEVLGETCVAEYPKYIAIKNVQVTDENGSQMDKAVILMKHNKGYQFEKIGTASQIRIPNHSRIIDVGGKSIEFGEEKGFRFETRASHSVLFFSVFLPTLIHVFLFTALFMLFGALKSNSITGIISVVVLFLCAAMPFIWDAPFIKYTLHSEYIRKSYNDSFYTLNYQIFELFKLGPLQGREMAESTIYSSPMGVAITRFIAFAYTYHYLNWFSKTSIIQWHKTPILNLVVVLVLWVFSVALYAINYKTGLIALFFLSFLHVFMEFPLNFQSILGISKNLMMRIRPATA
ncbi:MAG: hypothetical protein N2167_10710 [Flavobacteriales bacterium]|nr:hypothetical protein [Flavobacteriales bacterium]